MSSGADITDVAVDLTLDASWSGPPLRKRIWSSVQNTGESRVHIFEGAEAPALTDNRWQFLEAGAAMELMDSGKSIWAVCESGSTSTLAKLLSGRPTRYL